MGLPVRDGSGYDLFVFESGGSVEEMRLAVSDDLATWYDVGTLSGSIAEADLHGITPEGASFRYVRLTDAGKNNSGSWPGADIDAVCALNAFAADDMPTVYRFRDPQNVYRGALTTSFATRVVDFEPGESWTNHPENQSPNLALGMPEWYETGSISYGDLNLGAGGSVTLEFNTPPEACPLSTLTARASARHSTLLSRWTTAPETSRSCGRSSSVPPRT